MKQLALAKLIAMSDYEERKAETLAFLHAPEEVPRGWHCTEPGCPVCGDPLWEATVRGELDGPEDDG